MDIECDVSLDFFTALNDDCIFEIFRRIALDELCEMSQVCKKLRELVEDYFPRRYPKLLSKKVTIEKKSKNGPIGFCQPEKYVRCFSRFLQNIEIRFERNEMNGELLKFMRSNCGKNITEIEFDGLKWSVEFEQSMKDILSNVESMTFECSARKSFKGSLVDVLNGLPHLKSLEIYGPKKLLKSIDLWRIRCPQLESFTCEISADGILNDLKQFFQENVALKHFKCVADDLKADKVKKILEIIAQFNNIEDLFINSFTGGLDFSLIRDELKVLDDRENFKQFGMRVDMDEVHQLFNLTPLKTFNELQLFDYYGNSSRLDASIPTAFESLATLELIHNVSGKTAENLAKNLRNLDELYLNGIRSNVKEVIKVFVRYAPKLRVIGVSNAKVDRNVFNVKSFNDERKKLKNAVKLIINSVYCSKNTSDNELVVLKRCTCFDYYD